MRVYPKKPCPHCGNVGHHRGGGGGGVGYWLTSDNNPDLEEHDHDAS